MECFGWRFLILWRNSHICIYAGHCQLMMDGNRKRCLMKSGLHLAMKDCLNLIKILMRELKWIHSIWLVFRNLVMRLLWWNNWMWIVAPHLKGSRQWCLQYAKLMENWSKCQINRTQSVDLVLQHSSSLRHVNVNLTVLSVILTNLHC
jgi:hypothetical protein